MAYATLQDLIDRNGEAELIQLSDRAEPPAGEVDAAIVDKALADAGEVVDGYLQGRYRLPLDPVPAMLTHLACDLARYRLHGDLVTEKVKENHAAALKTLREIATGVIRLQAAGVEAAAGAAGVLSVAPERVFTADALKGF